MNILVVTTNVAQAEALSQRFYKRLQRELEFRHADSIPEALTQMRAALPDIVIGARETQGVGGFELLQRVRRDSDLSEVAFILLDESVLKRFSPSRLEAVLDENAHPADVLEAAFSLLVTNGRYHEGPDVARAGRPQAQHREREVALSGTLEVVALFDLVLSLTQKRNSGRLYLLLGDLEALLVFQQDRFVHAEYAGQTGEAAVLRIFLEAEQRPDAEFFFEPALTRLPQEGSTLQRSVQELLLRVAVELDRQRERPLD